MSQLCIYCNAKLPLDPVRGEVHLCQCGRCYSAQRDNFFFPTDGSPIWMLPPTHKETYLVLARYLLRGRAVGSLDPDQDDDVCAAMEKPWLAMTEHDRTETLAELELLKEKLHDQDQHNGQEDQTDAEDP